MKKLIASLFLLSTMVVCAEESVTAIDKQAGDYQTRNGDDGSVLDSEILEQIRSRCNAHAGNDESQEGETGQRYQLGRIVEVGNQRCGKEE